MKNSLKLFGILALTTTALCTQAAALEEVGPAGGGAAMAPVTADTLLTDAEIEAFIARARAGDRTVDAICGQTIERADVLTATAAEPGVGGLRGTITVTDRPVVLVDNTVTILKKMTVEPGVAWAYLGGLVGRAIGATRKNPVIIAYNKYVGADMEAPGGKGQDIMLGGIIGYNDLHVYLKNNEELPNAIPAAAVADAIPAAPAGGMIGWSAAH